MGQPDDRRVRLKDIIDAHGVADVLGISANSVYVYRKRHDDFPPPILVHGRCLMWHRGDITRWMRARAKR
jgi:predicted DNA-binding transcriptional regulator AlpA